MVFGFPSSYSIPAAPPSPDICSSRSRSSASLCAVVFAFSRFAGWLVLVLDGFPGGVDCALWASEVFRPVRCQNGRFRLKTRRVVDLFLNLMVLWLLMIGTEIGWLAETPGLELCEID